MKYSEKDLLIPALEAIRDFPGISTSDLIRRLEENLVLSEEEMESYKDRNDSIFSQTVRNLCGSHFSTNQFGKCVTKERCNNESRFWINRKGLDKISGF
jgi:hypothetical protein